MTQLKQKYNPLSRAHNFVPTANVMTFKDGVANYAVLPINGNSVGDARITNDTGHLYVWNRTTWVDQGDIINLLWSAIDGKPTSLVSDIDSAVNLKHVAHSDDQYVPSALSEMTEDISHRSVTDSEKSSWNRISDVSLNTMLNAFRIAQIGALTILNMVNGFVDEFEDESGIDTVNSINEVYNSTDDYYSPLIIEGAYGANICIGGTPSSSSQYDVQYGPELAFDGSLSSIWYAAPTHPSPPVWLKYDLGLGNEKVVQKLALNSTFNPGATITTFTFDGSNDDSNWTVIASLSHDNGLDRQEFTFSNATSYRYYRIYMETTPSGLTAGVRELEMFEYILGTTYNLSLRSISHEADSIPTSANIILFEEDIDEVHPNTDLKAYVSRDNGITYTEVVLTDVGNYIEGARILSGICDISSQPSGSDIKYEIKTFNGKLLNIHGTAVSWR
jgi:hypothetical protein